MSERPDLEAMRSAVVQMNVFGWKNFCVIIDYALALEAELAQLREENEELRTQMDSREEQDADSFRHLREQLERQSEARLDLAELVSTTLTAQLERVEGERDDLLLAEEGTRWAERARIAVRQGQRERDSLRAAAEELREALRERGCPDGGTCHHNCEAACFRVECCAPLSGVFVNEKWPVAPAAYRKSLEPGKQAGEQIGAAPSEQDAAPGSETFERVVEEDERG